MKAFAAGLSIALASCAIVPNPETTAPVPLAISATPLTLDTADPARARVGQLIYRGGLILRSGDRRFGGLSGLRWHNGKLLAVTDRGEWLVIRTREHKGRLLDIAAAQIVRLPDLHGKPLRGKIQSDAESINLLWDECGDDLCAASGVSISFEQQHRVWNYALKEDVPQGPPTPMSGTTDWLDRMPGNGGIEAMAGGDMLSLMVAEDLETSDGRASALLFHNGFTGDAPADRQVELSISLPQGFKVTDADVLGKATDLILLQRRHSRRDGTAARLVRVEIVPAPGKAGAEIRLRETLAVLEPPLTVDNMEGLAVRHEGQRTYLYIVSDDNFSPLQRTLLMKFELEPRKAP